MTEYIKVELTDGTVLDFNKKCDKVNYAGEIAHSFGGGGHRKAAGSTFNADDIQKGILNDLHFVYV